MVIGAGALQPFGVLHVATPLPWFPPMPIAILIIEGTTAMHLASLIMLSGIALSGVAMISVRTLAAVSIRLLISASSLSSAAQVKLAKNSTMVVSANRYFLEFILNLECILNLDFILNLDSVPNLSTGILLGRFHF